MRNIRCLYLNNPVMVAGIRCYLAAARIELLAPPHKSPMQAGTSANSDLRPSRKTSWSSTIKIRGVMEFSFQEGQPKEGETSDGLT